MQWKANDATDNSGVFARFPEPGQRPERRGQPGPRDPDQREPGRRPAEDGVDLQRRPRELPQREAGGEWNDYEITVVGQRYTVCLNGKVVNDYVSNQGRGAEGFVGIQNHDPASNVSFRDIRVKELPDVPPAQNIFDTIGITQIDTRPERPDLRHPAALLVHRRADAAVAVRSACRNDDARDDVPLRMPEHARQRSRTSRRSTARSTSCRRAAQGVLDAAPVRHGDRQRQHAGRRRLHCSRSPTARRRRRPCGSATGRRRQRRGGRPPRDRRRPPLHHVGHPADINFSIYHRVVQISEANRGKVLDLDQAAAERDARRHQRRGLPHGAHARGRQRRASRCRASPRTPIPERPHAAGRRPPRSTRPRRMAQNGWYRRRST